MGREIGQDSILIYGVTLAAVPFAMIALAIGIGGIAEEWRGQKPLPWRVATIAVNMVLLLSLGFVASLDHYGRDWSIADLIVLTCLPLVTTSIGMLTMVLILPRSAVRGQE